MPLDVCCNCLGSDRNALWWANGRWESRGKPCCPVRSKILQLIWGEAAGTQSAGKPSERREGPTRTRTHVHNKLLWSHTRVHLQGKTHAHTRVPTPTQTLSNNKISSWAQITNICWLFRGQRPRQHLPRAGIWAVRPFSSYSVAV